jgi:outer membrane protein assembly factor BamB
MRALTILLAIACAPFYAADWPMFRGPNAAGVSGDQNLPIEFGPGKNMVWRTPLPPGHSSPVLAGDSIFLTAVEDERLFTICLDRQSGRVKWRREAPRPRQEERHKSNNPAAPSAVSDGTNVYVFFGDFGLLAYGPDGNELWRQAMGPFNNPMGMGASPVLSGDLLLMICDQESGSYFTAIEKETGKTRWRVERPEYTRGFATPVLYKPEDGPLQAIIAGSYQLTSYEVATGKPVWWVGGLTWQLKPTPVMADGMIFVQGWAGGSDTGQQEFVETFEGGPEAPGQERRRPRWQRRGRRPEDAEGVEFPRSRSRRRA